jgi:hypothetical protein
VIEPFGQDVGEAERDIAIEQREPRFGQPSTERTEFRVLYDDKKIYFGVWLWDTDPSAIIGNEMKRDSGLSRGDQLKIVIDQMLEVLLRRHEVPLCDGVKGCQLLSTETNF